MKALHHEDTARVAGLSFGGVVLASRNQDDRRKISFTQVLRIAASGRDEVSDTTESILPRNFTKRSHYAITHQVCQPCLHVRQCMLQYYTIMVIKEVECSLVVEGGLELLPDCKGNCWTPPNPKTTPPRDHHLETSPETNFLPSHDSVAYHIIPSITLFRDDRVGVIGAAKYWTETISRTCSDRDARSISMTR